MSNITQSDVMSVIEKALELQPGSLTEATRASETEGWDSMGQLSILVALDKLFAGKIAGIEEMAEADSVARILAILRKNSLL